MSSMNDYLLDDDKLENGVKMPLFNRDGGISDDFIMVRWAHDDKVRAALDNMQRDLTKKLTAITPELGASAKQRREAEKKTTAMTAESVLDTQCTLVVSWSFSEKCIKANIRKFLKSRPDIAERIDIAAAKTKLFFGPSGKSS